MTTRMPPERRVRLEQIMAGLAAGDDAMVAALMREFGPELERAARFHAGTVAAGHVSEGDIVSLVADFAFVIADAAKSWRADGGALPWTFARRALRQVAIDHLVTPAQMRSSLDDGTFGDVADEGSRALGFEDGECLGTLIDIAERVPAVAAMIELWQGVPDEQLEIALEYRMQQNQGDPSAAATIADRYDKSPANVRKIASRVWQRVNDIELDDMMVS